MCSLLSGISQGLQPIAEDRTGTRRRTMKPRGHEVKESEYMPRGSYVLLLTADFVGGNVVHMFSSSLTFLSK